MPATDNCCTTCKDNIYTFSENSIGRECTCVTLHEELSHDNMRTYSVSRLKEASIIPHGFNMFNMGTNTLKQLRFKCSG